MKNKILITLVLVSLFFVGCSVISQKEVNKQSAFEPEQPLAGKAVFVSTIASERFNDLKLEDLPSTLQGGYAQSAVVYKDHIFSASINHILEYNQKGELVRYSDPQTFNCGQDLPSVITIAGDSLYAACWNVGIFEIDLVKNRAVYLFDFNNGLSNVQNLYSVVAENNLWVATVNGLFKIDRVSRIVKNYSKIFGSTCPDDNVRVFVFNNNVWVTSLAGCGAAEYQASDDIWKVYNPVAFNQNDLSRVDFDDFIVSGTGVFAVHQDGGPEHWVLSKFDPITLSWKRVVENTLGNFVGFLPSPDEYKNFYTYINAGVVTQHFKTTNDWLTLTLPDRRYLAMTPLVDDRYFLLSSLGIEQLVKGQAFPELLVTQIAGNTGARILVSSGENFVLGVSDEISEYGGDWRQSIFTVYDRQTKQTFTSVVSGKIDGEIPLIGFLKDPSAFKFLEQGSTLSIIENGETVLMIDPEKEQINFLK